MGGCRVGERVDGRRADERAGSGLTGGMSGLFRIDHASLDDISPARRGS